VCDAIDDCNGGWNRTVIADNLFYFVGYLEVLRSGETVADDGRFQSDNGFS